MSQSSSIRPTLLIQTASIADAVLLTALLEHLHQVEPTAILDVLVCQDSAELFHQHPFINQVFTWKIQDTGHRTWWALLRQIRAGSYRRVINVEHSLVTGLLTTFSQARYRIGFDRNPIARGFTRTVPHFVGLGVHEVARNLQLLGPVTYGQITRPRLYPTPADEAAVVAYTLHGPYLCIAPTATPTTRQLPLEKWLKLLAALPAHYPVYLLGDSSDEAVCHELAQVSRRPGVVNMAGKLSLLATAALMRKAVLNYVNDSVAVHLGSAVDAPLCVVYCSTAPIMGFGPLSTFARVVMVEKELECRPCDLRGYHKCPLTHFLCAHDIRTDQLTAVLAEAEQTSQTIMQVAR